MLSKNKIDEYSNNFNSGNNKVLSDVISCNPISKLSNNGDVNRSHVNIYNVSVKPHLSVTNQKSSGRCWLFAALNVVRREMCDKYNLDNFEFSQYGLCILKKTII